MHLVRHGGLRDLWLGIGTRRPQRGAQGLHLDDERVDVVLYFREILDTLHMRHCNGQADQKLGMAELARQVIELAQRKTPEHVCVAEFGIAIGEDVFPEDERVVKHYRAIELIKARTQWIGEPVRGDDRWLAAQNLDARGDDGTAKPHGAFRRGDGRREWHDQDVVGIAEPGAKAERAADHNATISFFDYSGSEPLRRWSEAVCLRCRDGR